MPRTERAEEVERGESELSDLASRLRGRAGFATRPQNAATTVTSAAVACESGEGCQM